jgi:WD40 repeat protein
MREGCKYNIYNTITYSLTHTFTHTRTQLLSPLRSLRMMGANGEGKLSGKVLAVSERKGIKNHLMSFREKIGLPTAIGTSTKITAVGTSRGVTLLFDSTENLIKPGLDARKHGSVTALCINKDATFMCAAYTSSVIVVWDLTKKQAYKTIELSQSNAAQRDHAPPVVDLEWLPGPSMQLVSVNAQGTCEVFTISKILFTVSVSRMCLLSGRGQDFPVVTVSTLLPNPRWPHPTDFFGLIAFSNESITLIVALQPSLKVLYKRARLPDAR